VGLRILAGCVVRTAAKYDLAARPLLSFWRDHCYKQFFEVRPGARRADAALATLGFVQPQEGGPPRIAAEGPVGPLWAGPLHDGDLLRQMKLADHLPAEMGRLLELWRVEADAPPLFFTTDMVGRRLRISPPPLRRALQALREGGYQAVPTSLHPKGVRTDAPWEEVLSLLGGL
jgi:tRNA (guanine26-N2/guanine27-N2)-dimethyltransferase